MMNTRLFAIAEVCLTWAVPPGAAGLELINFVRGLLLLQPKISHEMVHVQSAYPVWTDLIIKMKIQWGKVIKNCSLRQVSFPRDFV